MNTRIEEPLKKVPEAPKVFGEDGGHFYRYYDALADEIDEDMVKSLKAQLDGILIYAGLFAGVNSAFLALTLPEMSADPVDDTNALLLQLVSGVNSNITSADDLPSASFSPAPGILPVNVMFSLSLTLAILAAFLAVLGQQWLIYYRKRRGDGIEAQRWEQLRRYLGAKRWRLESILDDVLPSLLQLGLIIFCIAFAIYLGILSRWICYTVTIPLCIALACILFMAICAVLDQWCPFKSPLSRAIQMIPPSLVRPVWHVMLSVFSWAFTVALKSKQPVVRAIGRIRQFAGQAKLHLGPKASRLFVKFKRITNSTIRFLARRASQKLRKASRRPSSSPVAPQPYYSSNSVLRLASIIPREPETIDRLNAIAAKRVLCTSEDSNALIYTAVNLQAMESRKEIQWLLGDDEFYDRLAGPVKDIKYFFTRWTLQVEQDKAFRSAFISLVFSSGSAGFLLASHLGLAPFPPLPNNDINSQQRIRDLQRVVSKLNYQPTQVFGDSSNSINLSSPELCLELVATVVILSYRTNICRFERWFKAYSVQYDVSAQRAHTKFEPFPAYLLACAIQGFNKIQPQKAHSDYGWDERDRLRLGFLSESKEDMEWSFHAACNIVRMYCKCDDQSTLRLIGEVLPTFHRDPSTRPSNNVYFSLLRQVSIFFSQSARFFDNEFYTGFTTSAIDLSSSFIRLAQQSALGEQETAQLRDGLSYCIGILDKLFILSVTSSGIECVSAALKLGWRALRQLTSLGPHNSRDRRHGREEKLKEFMDLFSNGLKRRIDIFDDIVFLKMLGLEDSLMRRDRRRERKDEEQLEDYQKVYLEIKSVLNGMGFAKPPYRPCCEPPFSPPRPANPADPPAAQTVQCEAGTPNPGKGKTRLEAVAVITSPEEAEDSS